MFRLDFTIKDGDEDGFTERLFNDGAGSVSRRDDDGGVLISAIFDDADDASPYLGMATAVTELHESIWKYRWLEDFHGYALNDEVYIYPVTSSVPLATGYPLTIYLDPRDAFGDGRHPTTSLCLEMLYGMLKSNGRGDPSGLSMLDAGTGTGILSILAALLGVREIDAIDCDETSVQMALSNRDLNRCPLINVALCGIGEFRSAKRYDIIAANLLYGIIAENIDHILDLLRRDGTLIASGISTRWERETEELFSRKGLTVEEKSVRDEWLAFRLVRANS